MTQSYVVFKTFTAFENSFALSRFFADEPDFGIFLRNIRINRSIIDISFRGDNDILDVFFFGDNTSVCFSLTGFIREFWSRGRSGKFGTLLENEGRGVG